MNTENNYKVMSQSQNECIKQITKDDRNNELNIIKGNLDKLIKENQELKNTYNDLKKIQKDMQVKLDTLDKITNTIGLTGDDIKVSKAVKQKCIKLVKGKDSELYILFYGKYLGALYSGLKKQMGVNRYTMIYRPSLNEALKYIEKWKPSDSLKVEKIQELQNLNINGKLNQSPSGAKVQLALENYLRKTNGGTTRYAIQ